VNQLEDDYPVVLSQDVIWCDMDAFGHINNTVDFRYFEDARIAYFDKIGVHEHKEKMQIGPILATTHCDFRLPLEYPDRVQIVTRSRILSAKKFNMYYAVYSERLGGMVAEGEGLLLYYDYAAGKSCEIPGTVVTAINALERQVAPAGG
jgi:acyl-CoA thioester hydrolase